MRLASCISGFVGAIVLLFSPMVSAATLIVQNGILQGATGVIIGGASYDVHFVDGTCPQLFSGCNEPSDFQFNTKETASAAGQALLDQVFLDGPLGKFDTKPELTAGCGGYGFCQTIIPYKVYLPGSPDTSFAVWVQNYITEGGDKLGSYIGPDSENTTTYNFKNFARFDPSYPPVPEPATWMMMIVGFLLIGRSMRCTPRHAASSHPTA